MIEISMKVLTITITITNFIYTGWYNQLYIKLVNIVTLFENDNTKKMLVS